MKYFLIRHASVSENRQRYLNVQLVAKDGQKALLRFYMNGQPDCNHWWMVLLTEFMRQLGLDINTFTDTDQLLGRFIQLHHTPNKTNFTVAGLATMAKAINMRGTGAAQ